MLLDIILPWIIALFVFVLSYTVYYFIGKEIERRRKKREEEILREAGSTEQGVLPEDENVNLQLDKIIDRYHSNKEIEKLFYQVLFIMDIVVSICSMIIYINYKNELFDGIYKIYSICVFLLPIIGMNFVDRKKKII